MECAQGLFDEIIPSFRKVYKKRRWLITSTLNWPCHICVKLLRNNLELEEIEKALVATELIRGLLQRLL